MRAAQKTLSSFISCIVTFSASTAAVFAQQPSCMDMINNGIMYEGAGHHFEAEQYLKAAETRAQLPYEKFETSNLLGDVYLAENCYKEAEAEYKKCLTLCQKDVGDPCLEPHDPETKLVALYIRTGRNFDASAMKTRAHKDEIELPNDQSTKDYIERLQIEIKRRWYPPKRPDQSNSDLHLNTVCRWFVDSAGKFYCIHLVNGSGYYQLDKAGLDALREFTGPHPPSTFPSKGVGMEFTFTCNYFGHPKASSRI